MEIRQLNTFVAVACLKNFTQAAERLSYAQSSVTSQIQSLEGELGVRLFERLGKAVSLTAEGERLLQYAKKILQLCEEARHAVDAAGVPKGPLSIGAPESLCAVRLLPLFTAFHNRYPEIELSLKFGGSYQFLDMLKSNEIDLAFWIERRLEAPELVSGIAWPEPLELIAAPGHALAGAERVLPQDLAGELMILTEQGCSYRRRFLGIMDDAGVSPRATLESGSVQVMKQLAMSGMGIAFLPGVAAKEEIASGKLAALKWAGPAFGMTTHIVRHKDKWISPAMQAFLSLAEEILLPAALTEA